jgi:hypothetical protein
VARWAGWGAGPAGAGSTGGPTRTFLVIALVGTLVVVGVLAWERRWSSAVLALAAAGYFGLRLFGGLGRPEE